MELGISILEIRTDVEDVIGAEIGVAGGRLVHTDEEDLDLGATRPEGKDIKICCFILKNSHRLLK